MPTPLPNPGLTLEDASRYVRAQLGVDVLTARPLAGSVANYDYRLDLADGTAVVLKAGPADEMAAEAWACRLLFGLGVPVPAVVAYERDGLGGLATLVSAVVPGAPSENPAVAYAAGRWLRRIHRIDLPGWGPVLPDAEPRGAYGSWPDAVRADLAGVPDLVAAGILEADLARAATAAVEHPAILDHAGPGVLLHHDLKPQHLFGRGDELTAIIDWGDVRVGDPRADLARLSMAGPAVTAAFLDGYGWSEDPDVLARYRIAHNLGSLSYEYRAGGDWFDVYRDRIRADVARVQAQ